jgi:manganese-dependent inorganic pyrophosphatase
MIVPQKRNRPIVMACALAVTLVVLLSGCANTSATQSAASDTPAETSTDTPAETPTDLYTIDDEVRVRINRAELERLELVDGPIYVTGHKSPDSDTVCSSIAYADLLTKLGYDTQAVVLGDINNETSYILEQAGVEAPELLEDASGANMVLVDHGDYEQSAEGLSDANVITVIDHHGDGSVATSNAILYDARPIGATATIVWLHYVNYGIEPDATIAKLLAGAILADTSNFKSETTTTADKEALSILAEAAGIEDTDAFYTDLYKASISYEGMTDEQIFASDMKTYEAEGHRYAIGAVNVYDEEGAKAMAERMKAVLPNQLKALGVEYALAQISIFHDDVSMTYLVPADDATDELLKAMYGNTATFDGTSYVFEPGFSRKAKLVPDIDAMLASYPKS